MESKKEVIELKDIFSEVYNKLSDELEELSNYIYKKKQNRDDKKNEEINEMLKHVNNVIDQCYLQVKMYTNILDQKENVKKMEECMTKLLK